MDADSHAVDQPFSVTPPRGQEDRSPIAGKNNAMAIERRLKRTDLLLITFYMGFSSAIAQVLLIRELLTIFRGNEFIIGIIFAAWFLGIFIGARFNPLAAERALEKRVRICLICFPLIVVTSIYLAHSVSLLIPRTVGTFYSFGTELLLSLFFTIPVSFLVGFFFPPAVTLTSEEDGNRSGGNIYFIESFGSFSGGVIFSFILVDYLNPLEIILILLFLALLILVKSIQKRIFAITLLLPVILFSYSQDIEKQLFKLVWDRSHTGKLITYQRTRYQTVFVESTDELINVYGDGIFFYSLPDRYESRAVFHLIESLRVKKHRRVLVLGTGPGSIPYNLQKTDMEIYYFETDPDLWRIVNPHRKSIYRITEESPKLRVVMQDLRLFLRESSEKFDIIICFPPQPENIMLNRFYTREFYSLCKRHLRSNGIFISSIHGFSNYMSEDLKRFIASIYQGFTREFPYILKTSGETIFLIGAADKGTLPEAFEQLIERYRKRYPALQKLGLEREIIENFSPDELRTLFEKTQLDYFDRIINPLLSETDENLDLKPRGYWNHIILAALQEKSILYNLLKGFVFFPLLSVLLSGIAFIDIRRRHGRDQFINGMIIYAIGFISISTMILMIILYQNFNGIVYYRISLINALFMLGLTAGSYTYNRKRNISLTSIFLLLALTLGGIYLYTWIRMELLFWMAIVIFSFLCGTVFPTLFTSVEGDRFHSTASVLDAMDHLGSIIGSLITVLLLLPLIGIHGTIILNAALSLSVAFSSHLRSSQATQGSEKNLGKSR